MMKVNIERRSVDVPAACLAPGTFFTYKDESREESHGILLKINLLDKAVNLYNGVQGVGVMTAYQFSCIAPFAALLLVGAIIVGYAEWKGWF